MPTIAYYSHKVKTITKKDSKGNITSREKNVDTYSRIKVNIKSRSELDAIAARKDFVRFVSGGLSINDLIDRRIAEGRSDWYC
jgi:hypothetical protein